MSLDDISVRVGVRDVASLSEAVTLMRQVATLSDSVTAAVNAAAISAAKVGTKAQQAVAVAPQLKGVMDVFAQAFASAFGQWKGLNDTAKAEIQVIKAELAGMIGDLKAATDALRADFATMGNTATVRGLRERLGKMQESWQGQGNVGEAVSTAVNASVGTALVQLGQHMDAYAAKAGEAATTAVGAVKVGVDEVKTLVASIARVQQATDVAASIKAVVDEALAVMQAQQAAMAPPAVARQSRRESAEEKAISAIYTTILPDWPLVRDRLYEVREKVNDIDNNTKGLGFKMDKLHEYVRSAMSATRRAAKKAAAGQAAEDGEEPQDKTKSGDVKGADAPHVRGTPAAGKVGRERK